jgi:hypothetical protein
VWRLSDSSAARPALAVLAPILDEPEDVEPTADLERVERDLRREEDALLRPAGELDRRPATVSQNALEQLGELGELRGVDA